MIFLLSQHVPCCAQQLGMAMVYVASKAKHSCQKPITTEFDENGFDV
jgi:hypothetical protein